MSTKIRELPLEPTIDEMTDDELGAVSGGVSFEYGKMEWVYTQQKRADGPQH